MIRDAIVDVAAGKDLSYETAEAVMDQIMGGRASQIDPDGGIPYGHVHER